MRLRIETRRLALIAVFASLYAILSLIPVSRFIGNISFLSMAEIFSPLVGMILGPFAGGLSVFIGTFASIALGKPVGFDYFDFIPGVIAAVTAGLAIRGKVGVTAGLSLVMFAVYMVDPLSSAFIIVGSVPVPFLWMHMLSVIFFVGLSYMKKRGFKFVSQSVLISSVVFISTMNAHVAGAIMTENVYVYLTRSYTSSTILGLWNIVFYVYPVERVFFTVAGSLLAIAVLRALPTRLLELARGEA